MIAVATAATLFAIILGVSVGLLVLFLRAREQVRSALRTLDLRIEATLAKPEQRAIGIDQWLLPLAPIKSVFLADAYIDTTGRQAVPCTPKGRTALLIIAGQSNASNRGEGTPHLCSPDVLNFNLFDGRFYRAQDPLLGTSHNGINFATRLGDLLLESGRYDTVILAPIAVASTRIEQWVPGAEFFMRFIATITYFNNASIRTTAILWQQGEGNNCRSESEAEQYRLDLHKIVASIRGHFVDAPFFVALSTLCGGGPNEITRQGLRSSISPNLKIYLGPDSDALGADFRYDNCHFNERGTEALAKMWAETLLAAQLD